MVRAFALVLSAILLTACGGPGLIGAKELDDQRNAADEVARRVVSPLVDDLGASPPSADSLGRGLYAGCNDGDPDEASYFIDTFVTYDVLPPKTASSKVRKALVDAGLLDKAIAMSGAISLAVDDVTVDLTSQDKGGGSAGQNIFVSTGCLRIGKEAIADFNARNGRDVAP